MPPRQMELLSQIAQESTERFTRMIVQVLIFGNPKPAAMQLRGNSPEEERLFHLRERITLLQKQHNDAIHEANRASYQVQQSWQMLSEAYAALFAG